MMKYIFLLAACLSFSAESTFCQSRADVRQILNIKDGNGVNCSYQLTDAADRVIFWTHDPEWIVNNSVSKVPHTDEDFTTILSWDPKRKTSFKRQVKAHASKGIQKLKGRDIPKYTVWFTMKPDQKLNDKENGEPWVPAFDWNNNKILVAIQYNNQKSLPVFVVRKP